ncbi:MAG: glycosyltransferase [Nitrosotalea sp.]
MTIDYGVEGDTSSLNLISTKMFFELGKIMNQDKTFTIAALKYRGIGIGDINVHYDCISIPNMGGFRFPHNGCLSSKNLVIGLVGIDEVVLGKQVYRTNEDWKTNEPIIKREVERWQKHVDGVNFIHVTTNEEKRQMMEHLKIPDEKLHIIPLGVDHELFSLPTNKLEMRKKILGIFYINNGPYFIHVSERNWARKNVFRMLEAFRIARDSGINHKLIIVGKMDPVVYEKALSIEGVKIVGYVSTEHLSQLIQGADAMIFPSLHEGFGLPLLEAMACGVPSITSNIFSPSEVVGKSGLLVDPYNVSDIVKAITELSKNESLRDNLSREAFERSRKFDWSVVAREFLRLVKEKSSGKSEDFNFEESYDIAAFRTMVTICEVNKDLYNISQMDILKFDYRRIIAWCVEHGLERPGAMEFLLPFKQWLEEHHK